MAAPVSDAASSPAIETEPYKQPACTVFKDGVAVYQKGGATTVELVKNEEGQSLLYTDHGSESQVQGGHDIKKDIMVILPTEITCRTTELVHGQWAPIAVGAVGTEYDCQLFFRCGVEVRDVANELLCVQCGRWWATAAELAHHRLTHVKPISRVERNQPFSSDQCGKDCASSKSQLTNYSHNSKTPFSCNHCEKQVAQTSYLIAHQLEHSNVKLFSCNQCNKQFVLESSPIEHLRMQSSVKLFPRNECNEQFAQKSHFIENLGVNRSCVKTFSCKWCNKQFTQLSWLIKHQHVHNTVKQFSCNKCPKMFARKSNLVIHQRVHSGELFTCNECDKKFTRKNHLKDHILQVHMGVKAYSCKQCDQQFTRKNNMYKHLERCHL